MTGRAVHFNPNESTKEKEVRTVLHLKQLKKSIYIPKGYRKEIEPPAYDVGDIEAEKFNTVQVTKPKAINNVEIIENSINGRLEDVLGPLESDESHIIKESENKNNDFVINMILLENKNNALNNIKSVETNRSTESKPKAYYVYNTNDVTDKTISYNEDFVIVI